MPPPIDVSTYGSGSGGSAVGSILGALPIVGGVLNGVTQMFTNSANRRFQEHMYDRQRQDALADWNMQNAYNLPAAQMARLKAGGLNPNLVYGNGSSAVTSQGMPRGATPSGTSGTAPRFDITGMFPMLMYQLKSEMQAQQIENLKTQNLVLSTQAGKNVAQTGNIEVDTELKRFQLNMSETLKDVNVALANGNLARINIGNQVALDANERAAAMNSQNLQIAIERVIQLRWQNETNPLKKELLQEQIRAVRTSADLRELTVNLQKKGFTWSDPYWVRVGSTIIDNVISGKPLPRRELKDSELKDWFGEGTPMSY